MASEDSTSFWISRLKEGNVIAVQKLWDRYFQSLAAEVRKRLGRQGRQTEHDATLCTLFTFCDGVRAGRLPQLDDRSDLWRPVVTITSRKAAKQLQRTNHGKQAGVTARERTGLERNSILGEIADSIQHISTHEPTPQELANLADTVRTLLQRLEDSSLKKIASMKLQGLSNNEIADRIGCALSTVRRKLSVIRAIWHAYKVDR